MRASERRAPRSLDGRGRSGLGKRPGDLLDGGRRHAALLLGPCGGVFLGLSRELLEAHGVLLDELMVVQVLFDEHVADTQQKRQVGSGLDGHPVGGEDARVVEARIHDDDARALVGRGGQALHRRGANAVAVAATDEHDHLGVAEIDREVARADGLREARLLRGVAGRAVRVDVGRTERVDEALGVLLARRARILDDCQGFGAVLGQNVLHLGADFGKRGVPVDSFERTVGRAAHGLGQALVGIGDLRHAVTSTADGALGVGMHVAAAQREQLAAQRGGHEAALAGAAVAERCAFFALVRAFGVSHLGLPCAERAHARARRSQRRRGRRPLEERPPCYG